MLGDISPQSIKITPQAVVYPGRSHVTVLNVKRFSGRQYSAVDLSLLTRVVLAFPQTDPVIVYDTATAPAGTITWAGSDITIDLSDFSMPASVQSCYLIAYDAEHLSGQVLVDDKDSVVEFDFRNVSATGIIQPPVLDLVSEAPTDTTTYGRRNGVWVSIEEFVDIAAHVAAADPHTQYALELDFGQRAITLNTTAIAKVAAVDSTLANNADYTQITGIFNAVPDGHNSGITQQADSFTVSKAGYYRIEFWASARSSTNNTQTAFKFAVNGVLTLGRRPSIFTRNAGEVHTGGAFGFHLFAAGDVVTLWMASDKTANITIQDSVFGANAIRYT